MNVFFSSYLLNKIALNIIDYLLFACDQGEPPIMVLKRVRAERTTLD